MLPFYICGRAYDFLLIEAGALFGAMGALFYGRFGAGVMRRHRFPFLYMSFLIPPPGWAVNYLTAPLTTLVSAISANFMRVLGIPVYREGVTLYIAPYQLLVADACTGMNRLIGLRSEERRVGQQCVGQLRSRW